MGRGALTPLPAGSPLLFGGGTASCFRVCTDTHDCLVGGPKWRLDCVGTDVNLQLFVDLRYRSRIPIDWNRDRLALFSHERYKVSTRIRRYRKLRQVIPVSQVGFARADRSPITRCALDAAATGVRTHHKFSSASASHEAGYRNRTVFAAETAFDLVFEPDVSLAFHSGDDLPLDTDPLLHAAKDDSQVLYI